MKKIVVLALVLLSGLCATAFSQTGEEYPDSWTRTYVFPLNVNGSKTILTLTVPPGYSTTGVITYTMLCRDFTDSQTSTGIASYSIVKNTSGYSVPNVVSTVINNVATKGSIAGQVILEPKTDGDYKLKGKVATTGLSSPVCTMHFAINALTD
jgi:hypothetical protein